MLSAAVVDGCRLRGALATRCQVPLLWLAAVVVGRGQQAALASRCPVRLLRLVEAGVMVTRSDLCRAAAGGGEGLEEKWTALSWLIRLGLAVRREDQQLWCLWSWLAGPVFAVFPSVWLVAVGELSL